MNTNEFNRWMKKHQDAFPACATWASNAPAAQDTLKIWREVLANIDVDMAVDATMRMVKGIEPLVQFSNWHDTPRFVIEHVKAIERETKAKRPTYIEPVTEVFRCKECRDLGLIFVYRSVDVTAIRGGTFRGISVGKAATCCLCDFAKRRFAHMIENGSIMLFNSFNHVKLPPCGKCCTVKWFVDDVERIRSANVNSPVPLSEWTP